MPLALRFSAIAVVGVCLALFGCQSAPEVVRDAGGAAPAPLVGAATGVRYEVSAERSDVRFLVFRSGPLARLGHNHVVRAAKVRGSIELADDVRGSRFALELPVADFEVDAAAARADEGEAFAVLPDADAIAATRENMLGDKVLDAARYPTIEIRSLALTGPSWGIDAKIAIRVHGVEREMVVPIALERRPGEVVATAFLEFAQSDFGITPMSVLGGGLRVADTVRVRLRIVATRAGL